jgi:hypothetical protein
MTGPPNGSSNRSVTSPQFIGHTPLPTERSLSRIGCDCISDLERGTRDEGIGGVFAEDVEKLAQETEQYRTYKSSDLISHPHNRMSVH